MILISSVGLVMVTGAGWRGGGGTQKIHRWHPLGAVRFSGTCYVDK